MWGYGNASSFPVQKKNKKGCQASPSNVSAPQEDPELSNARNDELQHAGRSVGQSSRSVDHSSRSVGRSVSPVGRAERTHATNKTCIHTINSTYILLRTRVLRIRYVLVQRKGNAIL